MNKIEHAAERFLYSQSMLRVAHKQSMADGRLRFVYATPTAFKITTRYATAMAGDDCYWTNGESLGVWKVGSPSGIKMDIPDGWMEGDSSL